MPPRYIDTYFLHCIALSGLLLSAILLPLQSAYPQETPDEEFTLNLKNVDIRSLIETVSRRTGKNFIVDPRVKAKVTMISSEPVNQEKLYDIFLSVLEVHGFAAVTSGQVIKIVPSSVGAQNAIPVLTEPNNTGHNNNKGDELISHVIHLQNIPAQQMVEALRPLLPQSASISAESNSNTIVVTDRADNIGKIITLVNMLDGN